MDLTLIEAYSKTDYKTFYPPMTINIGKFSPDVDELLNEQEQNCWAFITSQNPYSQILSEELNAERHERLQEKLNHYSIYLGAGIGQDSNWKPELSFLVLGISKEEACRLGLLFEQNAIVVGVKGSVAELIMLI